MPIDNYNEKLNCNNLHNTFRKLKNDFLFISKRQNK